MNTQEVLLLISLGIIVLWTFRLARSKGLNPWYWGVGTALLATVAWLYFGQYLAPTVMAPLIFLLLFRSPLFRKNRQSETDPCPRCGAPDTGGLNFCVQCGWELSRNNVEQPESTDEAVPVQDPQTNQAATQQQEQSPASESWAPAPAAEDRQAEAAAEMPSPPPTTNEADPVLAQEATSNPIEQEAPPQPTPPPREPRPIPTPANLTARGIELFNDGRFQESIDQFTKAIALDPNYREAWERRAEAYGRLGRPERQKADQRRLEAI
jgi:tetratricopeptide (TPR) repeat protein